MPKGGRRRQPRLWEWQAGSHVGRCNGKERGKQHTVQTAANGTPFTRDKEIKSKGETRSIARQLIRSQSEVDLKWPPLIVFIVHSTKKTSNERLQKKNTRVPANPEPRDTLRENAKKKETCFSSSLQRYIFPHFPSRKGLHIQTIRSVGWLCARDSLSTHASKGKQKKTSIHAVTG